MALPRTFAIERFFARTVTPFFLLTGAGTALVGLYAVAPAWAMPTVALYTIGYFAACGFKDAKQDSNSIP